jgi:biotin carboxyl carrier protein
MKLTAQIGDQAAQQITLTRKGGKVLAQIGGRSYELEARPASNGSYLLLHEGRVFNCLIQGAAANGATVTVGVGGAEYAVTLADPKRLRAGGGGGAEKSGQLKAQMPGKVVRVLVAEGEQVEANQPLMVVEAMKMQNEMKAPRAGRVQSLKVAAGDTVNAGDALAVIE